MNFQTARINMVTQQIRPWQVFDDQVLTVLSQVPREIFVPPEYINLAYSDTAIPLADNQIMLPPKVVGRALQALALTPHSKILQVGTGTGYITACLAKLAGNIIGIEIHPSLFATTQKNLATISSRNITLKQGNGSLGWEENAPYQAILITGSYPLGIPHKVCNQLASGGRLFAICGKLPSMQAVLVERRGTDFQTQVLFETCVPPLMHAAKPQTFFF